jgi:hypothetical protein
MEAGQKVLVYHDPITRTKPDEVVTVKKVLHALAWATESGSPLFCANVKYADGLSTRREVAECDVQV